MKVSQNAARNRHKTDANVSSRILLCQSLHLEQEPPILFVFPEVCLSSINLFKSLFPSVVCKVTINETSAGNLAAELEFLMLLNGDEWAHGLT